MTDPHNYLYAKELPHDSADWASTYQPENEYEALMIAGPEEPAQSANEQQTMAEAIGECYRYLRPDHHAVLDLVQTQNLTLEEAALELGISRMKVSRLRDGAIDEMRQILRCNPSVVAQLADDDGGWEHAARLACWEVLTSERLARWTNLAEVPVEDWREVSMVAMAEASHAVARLTDLLGREFGPHELAELLAQKQAAYGHQNILGFGPLGVLVRLSDKISRRDNLLKTKRKGAFESLADTYIDIIGYAVLAVMNRDGTFIRELTGEYK